MPAIPSEPPRRGSGDHSARNDADGETLGHLKAPILGGDPNQKPGYWARRVLQRPWVRAIRYYAMQGELLHFLKSQSPVREPVLRQTKSWDGPRLDQMIRDKKVNIEAIHAQVVGRHMPGDMSCSHCARGVGPFLACVQIPKPDSATSVQMCYTQNQPARILDQQETNTPDSTHSSSTTDQSPAEPLPQNVRSEAIETLELCLLDIDTDIVMLQRMIKNKEINRKGILQTLEALRKEEKNSDANSRDMI
ncbi:hypothetical protein N7516_002857 [Penicillium verrucosum]|uniref:uncharacterized protein n=1 Tax=Penicillium verrucosum TaxID=60171 RepID=UPI002544F31E|nr:uncharacterized protein N7516_002857 [Penicillium verrucosum]KAJ5942689.1 hypothetical protein N7516_002857 [Penicillium verrucosum]